MELILSKWVLGLVAFVLLASLLVLDILSSLLSWNVPMLHMVLTAILLLTVGALVLVI